MYMIRLKQEELSVCFSPNEEVKTLHAQYSVLEKLYRDKVTQL